jgi:hypothetical protein
MPVIRMRYEQTAEVKRSGQTAYSPKLFSQPISSLTPFDRRWERFFNAATIAALPAALNLRFGFENPGVAACDGESVVPLMTPHPFFCPRDNRRRAAAETLRVGGALPACWLAQCGYRAAWLGVLQSGSRCGAPVVQNLRWLVDDFEVSLCVGINSIMDC